MALQSPLSGDAAEAFSARLPEAADWLVVAPLALLLTLAALLLLVRDRPRLQAGLALLGLSASVFLHGALLSAVWTGGIRTMTMGHWLPPFGISFTADLAGALLAFTGSLIGLASGLFALQDMDRQRRRYGFYPLLMLLMAGASGAFLTGDVFNLYVWFEVLLIAAFGLLALGEEREQLDGTLKYAVLNLIGTTLFLIATGLLYGSFGTLNMADLAQKAATLQSQAPLLTLASLYLLALAIKSAAFPLNAWLPASYPTASITVSALFAGLMTKIGLYALMRIDIMILAGQGESLSPILSVLAGFTLLTGALGALASDDIRRMAAYLVIAGIGSSLAGLAIGTTTALSGSLFYSIQSMIAMTALFWVCGLAGRLSGSFSLHRISGLHAASPAFSALAFIIFLAIAGIPPFSGFWPKVMLVKSALDTGHGLLATVLLASSFLVLIAVSRAYALAFWRGAIAEAAHAQQSKIAKHDPAPAHGHVPRTDLAPLAFLAVFLVLAGLYPEPLIQLTDRAALGFLDPSAYIESVFPQGRPQ
jgi:multicomponent Na+:H+ antiporter subunit D